MSDPVANAQLELACRLGLLEELVEALEDGADINCNGHSPVFFAVQHGHRELLAALVERGADISCFELEAGEVDAVVERLMARFTGSPSFPDDRGKRSTSSSRMNRQGLLARPAGEFAPVIVR